MDNEESDISCEYCGDPDGCGCQDAFQAGQRSTEEDVSALHIVNNELGRRLEVSEQREKKLVEALQPFADGYERAKFKSSWASSYTHADAPKNAYELLQALKEAKGSTA